MKTIRDFMSKNYDFVSYRLTDKDWKNDFLSSEEEIISHSIFAGCFAIQDEKIEPLDGDIYSSDEEVIWSKEWKNEKEGVQNGLTVLATADWTSLNKQL